MDTTYCPISRAPITFGTKVVVIPVAQNRFSDDGVSPRWVPAMLPLKWEYSDYGWGDRYPAQARIARKMGFKTALIRAEVWKNAHLYWHPDNSTQWLNYNQKDFAGALEYTRRMAELDNNSFCSRGKSLEIEATRRVLGPVGGGQFCMQICFLKMLHYLPSVSNYEANYEYGLLYDQPVLFHQIRRLFTSGKFTDKVNKDLSKLAILYSNGLKPLIPVSEIRNYRYDTPEYCRHLADQAEFEAKLFLKK